MKHAYFYLTNCNGGTCPTVSNFLHISTHGQTISLQSYNLLAFWNVTKCNVEIVCIQFGVNLIKHPIIPLPMFIANQGE